MRVRDVQELLDLKEAVTGGALDREVEDVYCGDLLSDVMANSPKGAVWLTIQTHQNIVAVALLRELAAVILVNGRVPDEETMGKAVEEGIPILLSSRTAYQVAGRLYGAGIGKDAE